MKPKLLYIAHKVSSGAKTEKELEENLNKAVESVVKFIQGRNNGYYTPVFPAISNHALGTRLSWAWSDYMTCDIPLLLRCDAIFLCKGWRDSKGASIEYLIAKSMGLEIIYEEE